MYMDKDHSFAERGNHSLSHNLPEAPFHPYPYVRDTYCPMAVSYE